MFFLQKHRLAIFFTFCFIFIVIVILFIISLNLPKDDESVVTISPTPLSSRDKTNTTPQPSPVEGESNFNEEEIRNFQQASQQAAKAYQDRLRRMPFITKLPHATSGYKIEITAVSDTVYITTYGPPSFQARYREEALAWIRANGGDTNTLTIQYRD